MNNQALLVIQIVFVSFFIWWMLSKKGNSPKPTVLNLEKDLQIQKELSKSDLDDQKRPDNLLQLPISYGERKSYSLENKKNSQSTNSKYNNVVIDFEAKVNRAKPLNVIFMWNGHSWDAYEVLGVTPGSSIRIVETKFKELSANSDEGQRLFLEEAFNCIKKRI